MERMEEVIPEADHQALQHMLSESAWAEQAVLDQVAQNANRLLGDRADCSLIVDESGFPKKGRHSVGVGRQWCGQLGQVENCQVGVFAALDRRTKATLIDERLFPPEAWTQDPKRCQAARIPATHRDFKRKHDLALEMIAHARRQGTGFAWVGFDGFHGNDPAFPRALDARGEISVGDAHQGDAHQGDAHQGDAHQDQRIYLEDSQPILPPA